MAGRIFMDVVKQNHATLLPIDSEHNAILQSLPQNFSGDLGGPGNNVLLTATGEPVPATIAKLAGGRNAGQACAHPNRVMDRNFVTPAP